MRSVAIPAAYASMLQKDDQNRVYQLSQNTITRFSADLSSQEEFPCEGISQAHPSYVFALVNDGNHYSLYYKASDRLSVVKIPE